MWTTARIRRHIQKLDGKPFSTRIFLNYGSRPAVDQAIWRLVKKGEIIRVARGLFIKRDAVYPSSVEIARAKAESFGRIILKDETALASALDLRQSGNSRNKSEAAIVFVSNGRTTSFRANDAVIKLKEAGPRKVGLNDGNAAQIIRTLWYLGKNTCNQEVITAVSRSFSRTDRRTFKCSFHKMPGWLAKYFLDKKPIETGSAKRLISQSDDQF